MPPTRKTSQRLKILEYLKKAKTHPTAEQVYCEVKKDLPAISLATVYKNLHLLAKQGLIKEVWLNNKHRFEGKTCNHIHFTCNKCGKIEDILQKGMILYATKKIHLKNKSIDCIKIIVEGRCKKCQQVKKNN